MRTSVVAAIAVVAVVIVGAVVTGLVRSKGSRPGAGAAVVTNALKPNPGLAVTQPETLERIDTQLTELLKTLCRDVGGDIGVAVIHVETGWTAQIEGAKQLPLYSVFKLPLAVTVLHDFEEKKVTIDKKVRIAPADVAPGAQFNTDHTSARKGTPGNCSAA